MRGGKSETVGVIANIFDLMNDKRINNARATPEKVFAIAVGKEEKRKQSTDSGKDYNKKR